MKPTSVIFLIFALVLFVSGMITCNVAKSMAKSGGVVLFEQTRDDKGNTVIKKDIPADLVTKLSLNLKNADVNVYGGAEKSYIELVNFDVNSYGMSTSNNTMSMTDSFDITSIFTSSGGTQFKGLRYIIGAEKPQGKKAVNIYISGESDMTGLSVSLDSGNVYMSNIYNNFDYALTIKKGSLTMDSVSSSSVSNISVEEGSVKLQYAEISTIKVDIGKGDLQVVTSKSDRNTYYVQTSGDVYYNGEKVSSVFEQKSGDAITDLIAKLGDGQVNINDIPKS